MQVRALHCAYHLTENERTLDYGRLALHALAQQGEIDDSIVVEIHEHLGTAHLDMQQCEAAVNCYQAALAYRDNVLTRENLKLAQAEVKSSGGFFKNCLENRCRFVYSFLG